MSTMYCFKVNKLPIKERYHKFVNYEDIEICTTNGSNKPYFHPNKFFTTFKELRNFYKEYWYDLNVFDEYGRSISWDLFEEMIINMNKRHTTMVGFEYIQHIRTDEDGYDWRKDE